MSDNAHRVFTRRQEPPPPDPPCEHLAPFTAEPSRDGLDDPVCADCVALGDRWVHLRQCLVCGYIGCCDSSRNRHMTGHAESSRHPIMRGIEPTDHWAYCYADDDTIALG
jgi:CPA2 family monovalent cation:H+ antiporter-2